MSFQGNLYTFGCSMTSYSWPTWADILGKEFDYYENWGRGSAGNLYIFESVIECLTKNKITSNDTIVILWSAISRQDYYQFGTWSALQHRSILDGKDELVNCPDGNEIISYAYFCAVDKILSSLGVKYHMFTWCDYDNKSSAGQFYQETLSKIIKLSFKISPKKILKPAEFKIKEVYNRLAGTDWPSYESIFDYNKKDFPHHINTEIQEKFYNYLENNKTLYFSDEVIDLHPLPKDHLQVIKKHFQISPETKNWAVQNDDLLRKNLPINFHKVSPERL